MNLSSFTSSWLRRAAFVFISLGMLQSQSAQAQTPTPAPTATPVPDTTPPLGTIDTPALNAHFNTTGFPTLSGFSGTASDLESGISRVEVFLSRDFMGPAAYWNGTTWVSSSFYRLATLTTGNWSLNTGLPSGADLGNGRYTLRINIRNGANLVTTVSNRFFFIGNDTVAPTGTITTPANGSLVESMPTPTGTVNDSGDSGLGTVFVTLSQTKGGVGLYWNGTAWVTVNPQIAVTLGTPSNGVTPWTWNVPLPSGADLPPAQYFIELRIYDQARNYAALANAVKVLPQDTVRPVVTLSYPPQSTSTSVPQLSRLTRVTGTATDPSDPNKPTEGVSGLDHVEVRLQRSVTVGGAAQIQSWNGSIWTTSATSYLPSPYELSWIRNTSLPTGADLPAGTYTLFVQAADRYSNSSLSITSNFSIVANHLPVASAQNVSTLPGNPATFSVGATDQDSDDLTYQVITPPAHGTCTQSGNGPQFTYTPNNGFSGIDTLVFTASDPDGVSQNATVSFNVTLPSPTNLVASPSLGQVALSWTGLTGTDYSGTTYTVRRSLTRGGPYTAISSATNLTTTSCTVAATNTATYYYIVTATKSGVESGPTNEVEAMANGTFVSPRFLYAVAGDSQVKLDWLVGPQVASFTIRRSVTGSSGPFVDFVTGLTANNYTDTSVTNGHLYYYYVVAISTTGATLTSNSVGAIPGAAFGPPTNISTTIGNGTVRLIWFNAPGAVTYKVKQLIGGVFTTLTTQANPDYTVTGLTNGPTYYFVISSVDANGVESANSVQVSARPVSPLIPPTGLIATAGDTTVTLSWNASLGASQYAIKRRPLIIEGTPTGGGFGGNGPGYGFVEIGRVMAPTLTFADSGLTNGTTYTYLVTAVGNGYDVTETQNGVTYSHTVYEEGAESATVDATPNASLQPPSPITAISGDASVTLSWPVMAGASKYEVARGSSSSGPFTALTPQPTVATFSDSGLTNGTTYFYTVKSISGTGTMSASSSPVAAQPGTPPAVVTGLTATGGDGRVTLAWTAVSGADGYWIYRSGTTGGPYRLIEKSGVAGYNDASVRNGVAYFYVVRTAKNVAGAAPVLSANSAQVTATPVTVPSGSSDLTAVAGNNKVLLKWTAGARATSYEIWLQSGVSAWAKRTTISSATAGNPPSNVVTGLANGIIYSFFIRELDSAGSAIDSNVVSATPSAATLPDKPGTPTFGNITSTSIEVIPPVLPYNATSMQLEFVLGSYFSEADYMIAVSNVTGTAPITVSNLLPHSPYRFRFTALNTVGRASSDPASNSTLGNVTDLPPLPIIGGVTNNTIRVFPYFDSSAATVEHNNQYVQWKLVSDPDSVYDAPNHQTALGGSYQATGVTGLSGSTAYSLRYKATTSDGSSSLVGPARNVTTKVDAPDAPLMPTTSAVGSNSVTLNVPFLPARATSLTLKWSKISSDYYAGVASYDRSRGYALANVGGSTVTVSNLSSGTNYYFWWVAVNETDSVYGPFKNPLITTSGTVAPPTVPAPLIFNLTENSFNTTTFIVIYDEFVTLQLQIKLSGASDSTYVDVPGDSISVIYDSSNRVRSVINLTPGQSYVVRYMAIKYNFNDPSTFIPGTSVAVTLPTATATWSAGTPISCNGIRYPFNNLTLKSGSVGRLNAFSASDWDYLTRTVNGRGTITPMTDTCSYSWNAVGGAGTFTEGATGPTVLWQAPTVSAPTWVTLQLTVQDQAGSNQGVSEVGTRNDVDPATGDLPLHFSVPVQVIP